MLTLLFASDKLKKGKKLKFKILTKNENETKLVAEKFGKSVLNPSVVSLIGDLGAGKTTFAKGFALGFGIKSVITSPTFTIMNEYEQSNKKLYHFDLYRLNDTEEFMALGLEQYFDLTTLDGVSLVEWASNCPKILPERHYEVNIIKKNDNERIIEIELKGIV